MNILMLQLIVFAHGYNVASAATSPGMSAAGSGDIYFGGEELRVPSLDR